jgi:hypothetical protein
VSPVCYVGLLTRMTASPVYSKVVDASKLNENTQLPVNGGAPVAIEQESRDPYGGDKMPTYDPPSPARVCGLEAPR